MSIYLLAQVGMTQSSFHSAYNVQEASPNCHIRMHALNKRQNKVLNPSMEAALLRPAPVPNPNKCIDC